MPPFRPTLLLTRPQAASERFARDFRGRFGADWPVILSPLMRTRWLSPAIDRRGARDIIFTSEAAVRGFARLSSERDLVAWCVGPRTAEAARGEGFEAVEGSGDALALAELVRTRRPGTTVLWPHGRHRAADMAELLKSAGIETISASVYDQIAVPLSNTARAALAVREPVLVPLFSPRSARLLADAAGEHAAPLLVAALSPAVAEAASRLRPAQVEIAGHPDSESLLAALSRLTQPRPGS